MTLKQLQALKLFAVGYSLDKIAQKLSVSKSTIRSRLKAINNTPEFDNSCGVRSAYKQAKYNLKHPVSIEELSGVFCVVRVI